MDGCTATSNNGLYRVLKLILHELLMGRSRPLLGLKGANKGPSLEVLEQDMKAFLKQMTNIHRSIYSHVVLVLKAEKEEKEILPAVFPGDSVYVKVFQRKWNIPRSNIHSCAGEGVAHPVSP